VGWYLKEGVISGEEGRDAKTYFGEKIRSIYSATKKRCYEVFIRIVWM